MAITSNGIRFNKTGACDRCPFYQPAPCCIGCPHFAIVDKQNTCLIYDKRNQICESCKATGNFTDKNGTHADCIDWPQHPFLGAIKEKKCAYKFETVVKADQTKVDEIYSKW